MGVAAPKPPDAGFLDGVGGNLSNDRLRRTRKFNEPKSQNENVRAETNIVARAPAR
jgi:hypothetical protein